MYRDTTNCRVWCNDVGINGAAERGRRTGVSHNAAAANATLLSPASPSPPSSLSMEPRARQRTQSLGEGSGIGTGRHGGGGSGSARNNWPCNSPDSSQNSGRRTSFMKVGHHLAVAMGKRTAGNEAPSTSTPHVIAMVGLPARGKTYISKKLSRYLNWIGINTKVFNLGDYRRALAKVYSSHEFFNPANEAGTKLRERVCNEGLADVFQWIDNEKGEVAVFDATNTTRGRRRFLYEKIVLEKGFKLFFVESVCDREDIIDSNIKEVKVNSPDYRSYQADQVVEDFKLRIRHYVAQYETLDETLENDYSFMQTYNVGEKITVHKIDGHIQSRIVYYLMNIKVTPRTIYLTRHGESEDNVAGRLGGDSDLSERGHRYARRLAEFINGGECASSPNFKVWTSWMKRSIQTAKHINCTQDRYISPLLNKPPRWKTLNEIDTGVCDEMTYEEVREFYPDEFAERDKDKFMYRYPRGESYEDLVARLEPVIMEIERQDSVLVVCHQAVIRCLLGYYLESSMDDMPWLEVPLHTVIKLEPIAYGCRRKDIALGIDSVSTHRGRPPVPGFLEDRFRRKPVRSRTVSMEPETIAEADGEVENGASL